jgi:hypothetical protein
MVEPGYLAVTVRRGPDDVTLSARFCLKKALVPWLSLPTQNLPNAFQIWNCPDQSKVNKRLYCTAAFAVQ